MNKTESDTPRTDAALKDVLQCGYDYKVKADFARELERENKDRKSTRLNSSH